MSKDMYFLIIPLVITAFGIFSCFWGYGLFKFTLVLLGFFTGIYAVITYGGGIITDINILIIIAIATGIIIGILVLIFYYAGIFLSGVLTALFILNYLGMRFNVPENILIILAICIVGGVLSLVFQRFMIVLTTAITGSFSIINGIGYLIYTVKYGYSSFNKYFNALKSSTDLYYLLLFIIAIIAVCGVVFQLKMIPEQKPEK